VRSLSTSKVPPSRKNSTGSFGLVTNCFAIQFPSVRLSSLSGSERRPPSFGHFEAQTPPLCSGDHQSAPDWLNTLPRIGDSDVWYLTLKLPKGARFTYRLVPNNPPVSESTQATVQADSYNPRRWDCPKTAEKFLCRSIVELPDAAPQPWIVSKPGTPAGRIEKQTIKSAIQKLERDLFIYTPAGYKSDGPANALLVLFDGDDILSDDFQGQTPLQQITVTISAAPRSSVIRTLSILLQEP
jgi:hypothetical protein